LDGTAAAGTGTGTGTGTITGTGSASSGTTGSACELDPWESKDGPAEATDLDGVDGTALEDRTDALVLDATLCEGADEEDFYTWTLSEAAYVGVEVTFRKEAQDVALELQDDAGQVLVRSEGGRAPTRRRAPGDTMAVGRGRTGARGRGRPRPHLPRPSTYDTMIAAVAARFSQQVSEDFDDVARNTAGIAP